MARGKERAVSDPRPTRPPAKTPEDREQQLIGLAVDLAEDMLVNGTAPAQVITHYLKASSSRERLEQERLRRENILLSAKADAIESAKVMEKLYAEAITAMRGYQGQDVTEEGSGVMDDSDDY